MKTNLIQVMLHMYIATLIAIPHLYYKPDPFPLNLFVFRAVCQARAGVPTAGESTPMPIGFT